MISSAFELKVQSIIDNSLRVIAAKPLDDRAYIAELKQICYSITGFTYNTIKRAGLFEQRNRLEISSRFTTVTKAGTEPKSVFEITLSCFGKATRSTKLTFCVSELYNKTPLYNIALLAWSKIKPQVQELDDDELVNVIFNNALKEVLHHGMKPLGNCRDVGIYGGISGWFEGNPTYTLNVFHKPEEL